MQIMKWLFYSIYIKYDHANNTFIKSNFNIEELNESTNNGASVSFLPVVNKTTILVLVPRRWQGPWGICMVLNKFLLF